MDLIFVKFLVLKMHIPQGCDCAGDTEKLTALELIYVDPEVQKDLLKILDKELIG